MQLRTVVAVAYTGGAIVIQAKNIYSSQNYGIWKVLRVRSDIILLSNFLYIEIFYLSLVIYLFIYCKNLHRHLGTLLNNKQIKTISGIW